MSRLVPQMAAAFGCALMLSACFPPLDPPSAPDAGSAPSFEDRFVGLWLIGVDDNRDWMRVLPLDGDSGELLFKPVEPKGVVAPGYGCEGTGTWELRDGITDGVKITYPEGCVIGTDSVQVFFIVEAIPYGLSLADKIELGGASDALDAYRFPDTWCEPDMSSCEDAL